jgi:hypothetical protein
MDEHELDRLLADPAVWAEPDPGLEDRVVAAIADAQSGGAAVVPLRSRRRLWTVLGAAAAVVLAAVLAIGLNVRDDPSAEFAATLSGTELAPDAAGEVTMTKTPSGWEILLEAEGLPRRDDGEYYQAWLKNQAGELVSIGTFNEAEDVTLWAGVPPSSYSTITVTRQRASDGPASSGEVVLMGTAEPTD